MEAPLTPEHFQLMSDKKLRETVEERSSSDLPEEARAALARLARYEMRRRKGDVPVRDRYTSS